eukprot:SAG31_NODE_1222_length_9294_cov_4.099184_5_plen_122_part_00
MAQCESTCVAAGASGCLPTSAVAVFYIRLRVWLQYHTYMHIAEPVDDNRGQTPEWEGITGRVKQIVAEQSREMKEEVAIVSNMLKDEVATVTRRQEEVARRQTDMAATLERIEALLSKSAT